MGTLSCNSKAFNRRDTLFLDKCVPVLLLKSRDIDSADLKRLLRVSRTVIVY